MDGSRDDRLYRVLLDLFGGDARGLLALVGRLPEGPRLRPLLPAPDQPLARIVDDTIHLLSRQDMIDAAFFAALLAHSPRRRGELVSIASAWDVSLDAPARPTARPPAVARAPGKSMYIVLAALGIAIPGGMYALMAGVNHRESPPETSPGTPNADEDPPPPKLPTDKIPELPVDKAEREEGTGGPAPPPPTPTRNSTRKPTLTIPPKTVVLRAWKCAIRLPASEAVTRLQADIVAGRWPLAKVGAWELPGTDKFLVRAAISAAQGQADAAAMDVRGLRGRGPFSPDRQACLDALNAGAI